MFVISIFHGQESIETTDPEKEEVNNSEVTIAIIWLIFIERYMIKQSLKQV